MLELRLLHGHSLRRPWQMLHLRPLLKQCRLRRWWPGPHASAAQARTAPQLWELQQTRPDVCVRQVTDSSMSDHSRRQQGLRTQGRAKIGTAICSEASAMQRCIEAKTAAVRARCAAYGSCQHKAGGMRQLQQPQINLARSLQCLPQMCKWAA